MKHIFDEDEYEVVTSSRACISCGGDLRKCNGGCNGMASFDLRRRDAKEVAVIKARRMHEREDAILAEAEVIKNRRKVPGRAAKQNEGWIERENKSEANNE